MSVEYTLRMQQHTSHRDIPCVFAAEMKSDGKLEHT